VSASPPSPPPSPAPPSPPADALVVLGGGVDGQGDLPPIAAARVDEAIRLFREGAAPRAIFSGSHSYLAAHRPPRTEARAMAERFAAAGCPPEAALLEEESLDTIGNAYYTRVRFLDPNGWRRIVVVTSDFHAARTGYIFGKVLGPATAVSIAPAPSGLGLVRRRVRQAAEAGMLRIVRDWLEPIPDGDLAALEAFLFGKHPAYSPL